MTTWSIEWFNVALDARFNLKEAPSMPWEYRQDDVLDQLAGVKSLAADIQKRSDALATSAQEGARAIRKQLDGGQGGVVPDLTKAAAASPRPQKDWYEQELIHAMTSTYPHDVAPLEHIHALQEARKAELTKVAAPDAPPLPNAISAFGTGSDGLGAYIVSLGGLPKPDLGKAAPRFVGGAGKREADPILPNAERLNRETEQLRQLAHLNLDQPVLESTVEMAITGGLLRDPRVLSVISQTPGFSGMLRELAAEAAERARRQDANAGGQPYLQRAESF